MQMYHNSGNILEWWPRQTVEAGVKAQLMQEAFKLLPQITYRYMNKETRNLSDAV